MADDKYGVRMLNPTAVGGRTWYNKWDNGHARTLNEGDFDPDDSRSGYINGSPSSATMNILGNGICTFPTLATSHRVFVDGPWLNTETTVYMNVRGQCSSKQLRGRSNHHGVQGLPYGYDGANDISCGWGNYEVVWDPGSNVAANEVEVIHDLYVRHIAEVASPNPPLNTWIGYKQVIRTIQVNATTFKVRVQGWILRNIADQNSWTLETEFIYDGTNIHVDPTGWSLNISTCTNPSDPLYSPDNVAGNLDANTLRLIAGKWCWIRINDTQDVDLKFFSVREIDPEGVSVTPPATTDRDVKRLYSGGSANSNPQLSVGGTISSVEAVTDTLNAAWDDVTSIEANNGDSEVRVFYLKYTGPNQFVKNVTIFLSKKAKGLDDSVFYAHDTQYGVNQTYPARAGETDVPPETATLVWKNETTRATGMAIAAQLNQNDFVHYLMKRTIKPNAAPLELEDYILEVQFDPEGGVNNEPPPDTGGGGGGGGGPGGEPSADFELMTLVGDFGTGGEANKTYASLKAHADTGCLICQPLGDYTYSSSAKDFKDHMQPVKDKNVLKALVMGNHDADEGNPASLTNDYLNFVGMSNQWTSYNIRNVHVLVLSFYVSYTSGSAQYTFADKDLSDASKNPNIDWIIVCYHEPIYSPPTHHKVVAKFRDAYQPLFDKYGVDLEFYGHNHNYCRSYPVTYNGTNADPTPHNQSDEPNYVNPTGAIIICAGMGGRAFYSIDGNVAWQPTPPINGTSKKWQDNQFDSKSGYHVLLMSNDGKSITGRQYNNDGNTLIDKYSITKGAVAPTVNLYTISAISASSDDGTQVASFANDNNMTTYWRTTSGNPAWLKADLGVTKNVTYVKIAFYRGSTPFDNRIHTFNVEYSLDNTNWSQAIGDTQNAQTDGSLEQFAFPAAVQARYVRVNFKGNTVNSHAGCYELDVYGTT